MSDELPLLPVVLAATPTALTSALETEGLPFVAHAAEPRGGKFVLFDSRLAAPPTLAPGQLAIDLRAALGDLDLQQLEDTRTAQGQWQVGPLTVHETISRVDKAAVRREALRRLREALQAAGGVWLRVGAFPYGYRTAFCLRLDHDAFVPDDLRRVMSALRGVEMATTHFVCASSHVARAEATAMLAGLDVGSHGYWHHSYRNAREQQRNIERGVDALRAAGLHPRGFAAPHGRLTPGLGQILDELGVDYSSEFGCLHDELPARSPGARAWQIPVHPVCLGIALEAARRDADRKRAFVDGPAVAGWLADYWTEVAVRKHTAGAPLFFYGHPDGRLGRYPEVIGQLLSAVRTLPDVWWTSLARFIDWQRTRLASRIRVFASDALPSSFRVECQAPHRESSLPRALEHVSSEGISRWRLEPGRTSIDLSHAARWQPIAEPPVKRMARPRRALGDRLRRWLDYERETPREEIAVDHWRGRLKRAIRAWRDSPCEGRRRATAAGADALRVRVVGSLTASLSPGGGERQMAALIDALQADGVEATAWRPWHDTWGSFDVLHLIGSCPEHLPLVEAARRSGKPVVLSPVAWFDGRSYWRSRRGVLQSAAARGLLAARRWAPWIPGWRRSLYRSVDRLLPNSRSEADQLVRLFGVEARRIVVAPNGADPQLIEADPRPFVERTGLRDFVLCAGRIEPRKNQLGLLRALAGIDAATLVLGDPVPGHEAYYDACRRAAGSRVRFLPRLEADDPLLASAYAACGCLAQPSWFETPGLAALEAAMTGAPLAVTRVGAAPEYFGRLAHYVDPHNLSSIRRGVAAALQEGRAPRLADHVRSRFTWQQVARVTRDVYASLV